MSDPLSSGSVVPGEGGSAAARWLRRALGRFRADASLSHSVLDAVPDAVVVVDAEGLILTANRAACETLGHAPGDARRVGLRRDRSRAAAPAPPSVAACGARREAAAAVGAPERVTVLRADGGELAADLALTPATAGGRPVTGVSFRPVKADASAINAAETRRRTLQTIVDAIPDPIVAVDRAGHVVLRNPASARLRDGSPHGTRRDGVPMPSRPTSGTTPRP